MALQAEDNFARRSGETFNCVGIGQTEFGEETMSRFTFGEFSVEVMGIIIPPSRKGVTPKAKDPLAAKGVDAYEKQAWRYAKEMNDVRKADADELAPLREQLRDMRIRAGQIPAIAFLETMSIRPEWAGPAPLATEFVYAALVADSIKIGYTTDVIQRMKSLRSPGRARQSVTLLAFAHGRRADEKRLHLALSPFLLANSNEYFKACVEVREIAAFMRRNLRCPSDKLIAWVLRGGRILAADRDWSKGQIDLDEIDPTQYPRVTAQEFEEEMV